MQYRSKYDWINIWKILKYLWTNFKSKRHTTMCTIMAAQCSVLTHVSSLAVALRIVRLKMQRSPKTLHAVYPVVKLRLHSRQARHWKSIFELCFRVVQYFFLHVVRPSSLNVETDKSTQTILQRSTVSPSTWNKIFQWHLSIIVKWIIGCTSQYGYISSQAYTWSYFIIQMLLSANKSVELWHRHVSINWNGAPFCNGSCRDSLLRTDWKPIIRFSRPFFTGTIKVLSNILTSP